MYLAANLLGSNRFRDTRKEPDQWLTNQHVSDHILAARFLATREDIKQLPIAGFELIESMDPRHRSQLANRCE
jgi:hypothetical protein